MNMKCLEQANSQAYEVYQRLSGAGGKGNGISCLMGTEFKFGVMKKYWKRTVVMAVQHCELTN